MKKTLARPASNRTFKPAVATVSAAFFLAAGAPAALAAENPFDAQMLNGGYQQLADAHKADEGKCGEAKCGAEKAEKADKAEKAEEGKCGEAADKATEGKCGEGKCGEGVCGGAES